MLQLVAIKIPLQESLLFQTTGSIPKRVVLAVIRLGEFGSKKWSETNQSVQQYSPNSTKDMLVFLRVLSLIYRSHKHETYQQLIQKAIKQSTFMTKKKNLNRAESLRHLTFSQPQVRLLIQCLFKALETLSLPIN